jgi:hypothetical protein
MANHTKPSRQAFDKSYWHRKLAIAKKRGACQALGLCRNGLGNCHHCKRSNGEIREAQKATRPKITAIWIDECPDGHPDNEERDG